MTPQALHDGVLEVLLGIAPEVDPAALAPDQPLRSQVDLDSMDWLNVIVGLHQRFGLEIPEADYAALGSLDAIERYLADRVR